MAFQWPSHNPGALVARALSCCLYQSTWDLGTHARVAPKIPRTRSGYNGPPSSIGLSCKVAMARFSISYVRQDERHRRLAPPTHPDTRWRMGNGLLPGFGRQGSAKLHDEGSSLRFAALEGVEGQSLGQAPLGLAHLHDLLSLKPLGIRVARCHCGVGRIRTLKPWHAMRPPLAQGQRRSAVPQDNHRVEPPSLLDRPSQFLSLDQGIA